MAKKQHLTLDQGASFEVSMELLDSNGELLSNSSYEARGQMRKHYESNSSVSFTTELIIGQITISLNSTATANLTPQRYVYDIELIDTSTDEVTRIVEGFITVRPEVTK